MWRLFYPLRYFRLVNDEKRRIDLWPTLFLAITIALPFVVVPGASFFHNGGFLDKLLTLTSALTGFYVAALVAAATFSHPDLDKVFTAGSVVLVTRDGAEQGIEERLTRREFVCTIFGYLAFSSFLISLFGSMAVGVTAFNPHVAEQLVIFFVRAYATELFPFIRAIIIFCFTLAISHMVVVTGLGLYYLTDRLHRRDLRITTPKGTLGNRDDVT